MKAIIFDFDGVIVNSFEACFKASQFYDPNLTREEYKKMFEGNIFESLEKEHPEGTNLDNNKIEPQNSKSFFRSQESKFEENIDNDQPNFFEEYYKRIQNIKPNLDVEEIIKEFSTTPLYIVSSTLNEKIDQYLKKYNLRKYFKKIMGPEVSKSKVDKLKMILDLEKITPKEAIFITDTLGDLREAQKVGIDSIGVTWGFHTKDILEKGDPMVIIERATQLAKVLQKL